MRCCESGAGRRMKRRGGYESRGEELEEGSTEVSSDDEMETA